jgi:hypothetical protein
VPLVLAFLVACAGEDGDAGFSGTPEYELGGQTGSLIPDCDVAPLSGQGQAVPAGDAVAVIYAGECDELPTNDQVALTGPDDRPIALTLEPLQGGNAYLVRASESLSGGSYEIALPGGESRPLEVAAELAEVPESLGAITALEQAEGCPEELTFDLALDVEALAHAPLMRWYVSVDRGDEQLWVDYGALDLSAGDGHARLTLPRCGTRACLERGEHSLTVWARVAGESFNPAPLELSFYLDCPAESAEAPSSVPTLGCQLRSTAARSSLGWLVGCLGALTLLAKARRRGQPDSV